MIPITAPPAVLLAQGLVLVENVNNVMVERIAVKDKPVVLTADAPT